MRIERLAQVYEGKSDEELVHLAGQANDLTNEALTALRSELARRRIQASVNSTSDRINDVGMLPAPRAIPAATGVAEFVAEVLTLYHKNFWLFFGLVAPAVALGWWAIAIGSDEAREIAHRLLQRAEFSGHLFEYIEMGLAKIGGLFGSWTVFALAFGGICVAVQNLATGVTPSISECFVPVRMRFGAFLRLSSLLFAILGFLMATGMLLVEFGIIWALKRLHVPLTRPMYGWIGWACCAAVLLIVSRFALAIPALVLDKCRVGESIFRSDAYTEGRWLILAALLTKSVAGGYMAGLLPFWIAGSILGATPVPGWVHWALRAASVVAVSIVEPTMFIGFTLLYLQKVSATVGQPPISEQERLGQVLA